MFTMTPGAAEQIRVAAEMQDDNPALRVAARIDDDGQMSYGMGFDEERENDLILECEGVRLLISPLSQGLLEDTTLDFVELRPGEFQFIFINPKDDACAGQSRPNGCGSCGGGCS
jgi:iron-sulfur cluster assembly protein